MARKSFLKSTALAALAASIALTAVPAAAQGNPGARWGRSENAGQPQGGRGDWQARREARAQQEAAPAAQAQGEARQRNWSGRGDGNGRRGGEAAAVQAAPADAGQRNWNRGARRGQAVQAQPTPGEQRGTWRGNRGDGQWQGRGDGQWQGRRDAVRTEQWRDRRDDRSAWRGNRNDTQRWNNNWRRDNRYNWSGHRNANRNIFRGGSYYAPYRNYSYRPLGIGFVLDNLFFGNQYWINDPGYYRLPPAYGPYRWVRYYDDVVLVDIYTGEVIDVIRDFFW